MKRGLTATVTVGAVLMVATGCANTPASSPSGAVANPTASSTSGQTVTLSTALDHIHAATFDTVDGSVLVATHAGIWRVSTSGQAARVGAANDDFMGFATATPGRWLGSGHPGPGSSQPDPMGLIESTDQGGAWTSVSRSGQTDFHALAARGNVVVGAPAHDQTLLRSDDSGATWSDGAALEVGSLAFAGDRLLAVTASGLAVSDDAGGSFQPMAAAPAGALLSANGAAVWVIDSNAQVWSSPDAGRTWQPRGSVPRDVAAVIAVDSARAYAMSTTELITLG